MALKDYKLSKILSHKEPIRTFTETKNGGILTCSIDGTVTVWNEDSSNPNALCKSCPFEGPLHGPKNLVFSVKSLNSFSGLKESVDQNGPPEEFFVSCGSDATIKVWSLDLNVVLSLEGHIDSVCSISEISDNHFVSGSFDRTAKIWKNGKYVRNLDSNHKYGVEVCVLRSGKIITASYEDIFIWSQNNKKKISKAHSHSIRQIIPFAEGFATCSNDGYVKIWSAEGVLVWSLLAHSAKGDQAPFVYSIACSSSDREIISAGEDSNCFVWGLDGNKKQAIKLPKSIREIQILKNGDLALTNGVHVYIFTRQQSRVAPEQVFKEFQSHFQSKKPKYELSEKSVLKSGGLYDGQKVFVKEGGETRVHEWSSASNKWRILGFVEASEAAESQSYKGEDKVVDIEKTDGSRITVNFNTSRDPEKVALELSAKHGLSESNRQQIKEYLEKIKASSNITRRAEDDSGISSEGKTKITSENKAIVELETIPIWKKGNFEYFTSCSENLMCDKIDSINTEMVSKNPEISLNPEELKTVLNLISRSENYHAVPVELTALTALQKMAVWDASRVPSGAHVLLPVLDSFRVLACYSLISREILNQEGTFLGETLFKSVIRSKKELVLILFSRILTNALGVWRKNERDPIDTLVKVNKFIDSVIKNTSDSINTDKNFKKASSLVYLIYNYTIWRSKNTELEHMDSLRLQTLISPLFKAFKVLLSHDARGAFSAATTLASIITLPEPPERKNAGEHLNLKTEEMKKELISKIRENNNNISSMSLKNKFEALLRDLEKKC